MQPVTGLLFAFGESSPGLVIALSERSDGSMRLAEQPPRNITENRQRFLDRLGVSIDRLVSGSLVHGGNVRVATSAAAGQVLAETDGLITIEPNLFLSITVADCLPIFLYDQAHQVVGLLHAGWKGLAVGIIGNGIRAMVSAFDSQPDEIAVAIGPGIGPCHYEVDAERAARFVGFPDAVTRRDGKLFLDLKAVARQQLLQAGVDGQNIEVSPDCTACLPERYFSYRRDRPEVVEPMLAVIGRKM